SLMVGTTKTRDREKQRSRNTIGACLVHQRTPGGCCQPMKRNFSPANSRHIYNIRGPGWPLVSDTSTTWPFNRNRDESARGVCIRLPLKMLHQFMHEWRLKQG